MPLSVIVRPIRKKLQLTVSFCSKITVIWGIFWHQPGNFDTCTAGGAGDKYEVSGHILLDFKAFWFERMLVSKKEIHFWPSVSVCPLFFGWFSPCSHHAKLMLTRGGGQICPHHHVFAYMRVCLCIHTGANFYLNFPHFECGNWCNTFDPKKIPWVTKFA